ncbi:peptide-methionine (S)-S-oxide reductase MsrA [Neisseriaceae bacterium JH1-16]|nr:peptide-methionine (S)-S-oxide reductase MsrA [Neisseriaceae bacterium JH1-16]
MNSILTRWRAGPLLGLCTVALAIACGARSTLAAESAVTIPPPAVDEPVTAGHSEVAVLAGGCFWGVQGVFQHVRGVTRAVSGYSGGAKATASYETVSEGNTGHAESVQITYDPHQISYGRLLQIYFSVVHNPTELNRQGPDSGTQYRSAIFPANDVQRHVAQSYIAQLGKAGVFKAPIVTRTDPLKAFYPAEGYHQDFLTLHPDNPYIVYNDLPKVADLKRLFPSYYRDKPVLVSAAR